MVFDVYQRSGKYATKLYLERDEFDACSEAVRAIDDRIPLDLVGPAMWDCSQLPARIIASKVVPALALSGGWFAQEPEAIRRQLLQIAAWWIGPA